MAVNDALETAEAPRCPVVHYDPYKHTPLLGHVQEMDELRELGPVIRSSYGLGWYNITRFDDVYDGLRNPGTFSARAKPYEPNPSYQMIPLMLDPPEQTKWRQLIAPHFSPAAAERLEGHIRAHCANLIETVAKGDGCDFLQDFANRFPTVIFMEVMGLPISETERFVEWETEIIHRTMFLPPDGGENSAKKAAALRQVTDYFDHVLEERRETPRDDLLTACLSWTIDDEPIPREQLVSFCLLLFLAGLDTVASQLGYSFFHLATHPEDRQRIVQEPEIIAPAVEELLRVYSFVDAGRKVMQTVDVGGVHLEAGDMVTLWIPSACRDPRRFHEPDQVNFDREDNSHIAFGAGAHRCLGSHLARMELRIALEEWHKVIPDYRLDETVEPVEYGTMFGPRALALRWT